MRLGLLPIGPVAQDLVTSLSDSLRRFGIEPEILPEEPVPRETLDATRGQYRAEDLLGVVTSRSPGDLAAVTTVDLYKEGWDYIFGLANTGKSGAIVSVRRLASADREQVADRLLKEVVHELGHTWGLVHCDDALCVMHFSNEVAETDAKQAEFCPTCRESLPRGVGGASARRP